jgi:hypothetical protein
MMRLLKGAKTMTHRNEFQASGTSPSPDFLVENHGTIFLLQPLTPAALFWIEEHLPEDRMTFGSAACVEHRFIRDVVRGILHDGLVIK